MYKKINDAIWSNMKNAVQKIFDLKYMSIKRKVIRLSVNLLLINKCNPKHLTHGKHFVTEEIWTWILVSDSFALIYSATKEGMNVVEQKC